MENGYEEKYIPQETNFDHPQPPRAAAGVAAAPGGNANPFKNQSQNNPFRK
jgi:hypothetical protein